MLSDAEFLLGAAALLATPGPTNTLLAASGAARGLRPSLGLLAGELAGYLAAIVVSTAAVGPMIATRPTFGLVLRLAVCLYVLYLAWVLWRESGVELADARPVTVPRVFVTTLLNPKAAIFAFALLPTTAATGRVELGPRLALLSLLIVTIGCSWIGAGAFLKRGLKRPETGYRLGAAALVVIAAIISGNALAIAAG